VPARFFFLCSRAKFISDFGEGGILFQHMSGTLRSTAENACGRRGFHETLEALAAKAKQRQS
jgi:hypothetical protein